jgi:choline dehydrogenase-like flavoprotein
MAKFDPSTQVDFVVIGSGISGGIMAKELSAAGFDVVVLEQGDYLHEQDFRYDQLNRTSRSYNMKGPGVFQLNMALSRTFAIQERKAIQLRAEAFNLPNHLNPSTPNTSPLSNTTGISALNVSNFGQITNDISGNNGLNAGDYRIIQLAMKFVF